MLPFSCCIWKFMTHTYLPRARVAVCAEAVVRHVRALETAVFHSSVSFSAVFSIMVLRLFLVVLVLCLL